MKPVPAKSPFPGLGFEDRPPGGHDLVAAVLDTVANLVVVLDRDGRIVRFNEACERATGYGAAEVVGKSVFDLFIAGEELPDVKSAFGRLRSGEVPTRHRNRWRTKDGSERLLDWTNTCVFDERGEVEWVIGTATDVTERARVEEAETALRDAHERLRIHVETTPLALVEWDAEFRVRRFSPRAEQLFGWSAGEILGRRIDEIPWVPDEDWPAVRAVMGDMSSGARPTNVHANRNVRKDGSEIYCEWYNSTLHDADGRLVSVLSLVLDVTPRKLAEEALRSEERRSRRSEERFRRVFAHAATGIAIVSADGTFESCNPAYAGLVGYAEDELRGLRFSALVHPEDLPATLERSRRLRAGEIPFFEEESRYVRKDGQPVWVHEYVSLLADGTPAPPVMVLVTDVTERKRAADELAIVTRLYAVLSRVNEAIVRTRDRQALFDEVCRIVADEGGFPLVWVGLRSGRAVEPAASWGRASDYVREMNVEIDGELGAGPTGTSVREDRPVINDDFGVNPSTWPWREATLRHGLRASAAFPLHQGGAVIGALTFYAASPGAFTPKQIQLLGALCADVSYALDAMAHETRRTQAERALRESEQRFRSLADRIPQLAWTARPDGFVDWYNRRWYEYTGTTPEQMEGWGWESVHDPATLPEVVRRWRASVETGADFEMEFPLRGADGTFRRFLTRVFALRDEDGDVVQWFGTNTDVTDLVLAQQALREADRRKTEFLAVLSHELRNPLAPIRNSIYLLERAPQGGEQATRSKEVIRRQTEHLTRLVDDLLDMTRVSAGKIALQRTRVDLRDVVRRTADDLVSVFVQSGVALRLDYGPRGPLWVDADPTRLAQVLGNLLQNSVKFTPSGGTVTVTLDATEATVELRVRDDGVGMDPATIERMFEPFTQADRTLARTQGGLGLGLALVKGLVELHGGTVEARSDGLGRGAELVVRLARAEPDASGVAGRAAARGASPRTILVIEDNVDAGLSLADILELEGHRVRIARDATSGLALARELRPDAVLCDIGLPDLDGYEVARTLRRDEALRGTLLVALSGYAQPEDRQRASEAGFDAHLAKPPDLDELVRVLHRVR